VNGGAWVGVWRGGGVVGGGLVEGVGGGTKGMGVIGEGGGGGMGWGCGSQWCRG